MADLSTLDVTQPPDSQAVSQGAARIRETRDATVTSFGIEHALAGMHKIPLGTTAARPAAGNAGRLYINTDLGLLQYDSGSAWLNLSATNSVVVSDATFAAPITIANGAFTPLVSLTANPNASGGGFSFLLADIAINAGTTTIGYRLTTNAVPSTTRIVSSLVAGTATTLSCIFRVLTTPGSSPVFTVEAEGVGATHTCTAGSLTAFLY